MSTPCKLDSTMNGRKSYWKVVLSLVVVAASATGCSGARTPRATPVTSWDIDAPYSRVWNAARDALREFDFVIASEDAGQELIETDRKVFRPGSEYSSCRGTHLGRVTLRFGEGVQGVRVNIATEFTRTIDPGSSNPPRCESTGELERELKLRILGKIR